MAGLTLAQQAARMLRRALTSDETARMERAASQGYTVAGRHYGDFTKDLPQKFDDTGERAAFHMDLSPSGNQALARSIVDDSGAPNMSTEMVLARLRNSVKMSDEAINTMRRTEKAGLQGEGTTGAVYPNAYELSGGRPNAENPRKALLHKGAVDRFAYDHNNTGNMMFNPSAAIFDPADLRLFDAKFDPKNVGKVGWRGSATVPGMAGAGAVGATGASVMNNYRPQEPQEPQQGPTDALENISLDDMPMEAISYFLRKFR